MEFKTLKKAALFIDYENANATDSYNPLLLKINSLGYNPCIRKIISSKIPDMDGFEDIIKENELEFVLTYKPIKKGNSAVIKKKNLNNADFRMYIEVLKTLYSYSEINTFFIYTSDDDYTELICTIKREGKEVIGIGNKNTTSPNYISLFNSFIYVEDIFSSIKDSKKKNEEEKLKKVIKTNKKETKKSENKTTKKSANSKLDNNQKTKASIKETNNNAHSKDEIFYSILKDSTNEVLLHAKNKGQEGPFLIANIVSKLKDNYKFLKDYKKISAKDFRHCGFHVETKDGNKVKSFIDLNKISF